MSSFCSLFNKLSKIFPYLREIEMKLRTILSSVNETKFSKLNQILNASSENGIFIKKLSTVKIICQEVLKILE